MDQPQDHPIEVDFDAAYRSEPPWEVGRAQSALFQLLAANVFESPVLDVGCGTGENALALSAHGLDVFGVDAAQGAIDLAVAKASDRGLGAEFIVADAFELGDLGREFATVLDSALLHVIGDRRRYVDQLAQVVRTGGRVVLLEISDSADIPYPKISEAEIRESFPPREWRVDFLDTATFETTMGSFPAWVGVVSRLEDS